MITTNQDGSFGSNIQGLRQYIKQILFDRWSRNKVELKKPRNCFGAPCVHTPVTSFPNANIDLGSPVNNVLITYHAQLLGGRCLKQIWLPGRLSVCPVSASDPDNGSCQQNFSNTILNLIGIFNNFSQLVKVCSRKIWCQSLARQNLRLAE